MLRSSLLGLPLSFALVALAAVVLRPPDRPLPPEVATVEVLAPTVSPPVPDPVEPVPEAVASTPTIEESAATER